MLDSLAAQKILVVDDEAGIRDGLKCSLEQLGYEVQTADSGESALYQFKNSPGISCVLSDFKMPGLDGFDVLKEVKKQSPNTPFVLMTGFGSIHHAVNAMQMGADDYLCKPFRIEDLEKIIMKVSSSEEVPAESPTILSVDPIFQTLLKKAQRASRSQVPILIEGASGTGKELLARQIHDWSDRSDEPWVAINCAALPAGLLESELFGFEKGAFTGAMEKKLGKFEQANGGTLLLDEIGELDLLLQAKLLRVLQEGELDRLGGRKPLKINVRIIATTNKNLEQLVAEGRFREDLFFRLYGVRFTLPGLRERPKDIQVLVHEFLKRQSDLQGRELVFGENVVQTLEKMPWPGNIRELERAVERAAVLSETGVLLLEHFEFSDRSRIDSDIRTKSATPRLMPLGDQGPDSKSIREMERDIILKALEAHNGNRTHTAKSLGMSLRTLRHKIKQYRDAGVAVEEARQNRVGKNEPFFSDDSPLAASSAASIAGQYLASLE